MLRMVYTRSLFIFRRDLRLEDNTALIRALASSREVAAAFIFDPRQCEPHDYFSPHAFQFLQESLDALASDIKKYGGILYRFYGQADEVVKELLDVEKFDAVFINKDYTPFSRRRDTAIKKACQKRGVAFEEHDDALLCAPGSVMKQAGGPYAVFTPFYKKASLQEVSLREHNIAKNFIHRPVKSSFLLKPGQLNEVFDPHLAIHGGRLQALKLFEKLSGLGDYARERDIPALDATSHLSAHLKFGTVSPREVFYAVRSSLGERHPILQQLYWRDFFYHVGYYYPHVFKGCFYEEYDAIPWQNDKKLFTLWCEGRTGVPIVDAGMRELNITGFMQNRVRMIAASYLIKDLHIDWRWGEKYFASKLVDYDPLVNNGNWQWVASTGCDHQPYFRIFNPWLQHKRFDPDCTYVRKWVLELENVPVNKIFDLGPKGLRSDAVAWIKMAFKEASRRGKNH
jgi:deoxyribodipyrimidine photo-lyase